MRNLMMCGFIAAALAAVTAAEPASQPAQESARGKKLIEFGWDEPDTAFMRKHAAQMDATPFDGCVYHIRYLQADGKDADFLWSCRCSGDVRPVALLRFVPLFRGDSRSFGGGSLSPVSSLLYFASNRRASSISSCSKALA